MRAVSVEQQSIVEPNSSPHYNDGEITISELLFKLWNKRGFIVFLPLVLAGLTLTTLIATKASSGDTLSYHIELIGIEKGLYPNGTAFSPQDLLNPEVIGQLAERFGIDEPSEITKTLSVSYGTPLSSGVQMEFQAALAASAKSSPDQVAVITDQYTARILDTSRRGLRIALDYVSLGIDKPMATELAYALPGVWSEVYTSRFNILMDTGITTLTSNMTAGKLTSAVESMEADLQLRSIETGLQLLAEDSRLRALSTEDGASIADVQSQLKDFRSIYFDPLYAVSFADGDTLSRVYRQDLTLRSAEIDEQLLELDKRITAITELQSGRGSTQSVGANNSSGSQVQIEGDALGQLVSLSRQASLAEYLQESFDARAELIKERAELQTRLRKMGDGDGEGASAVSPRFAAAAQERFEQILNNYNALTASAKSLLNAETPRLHKTLTSITSQQRLITERDLLLVLLAIVLGGMLAVMAALLWPVRD